MAGEGTSLPASVPGFEFATATRIVFGAGSVRSLGALAAPLGRRVLVVTGRTPSRAAPVLEALRHADLAIETLSIAGEPTTDAVAEAVSRARRQPPDLIVGVGGGSAIDAAKALAGLIPSSSDLFDHLEVVGRGRALEAPPLPWIAVPTTAGAGAEVTRNAVLTSPAHRVKASLRSPLLLARLAVVDPELALGLPPDITAATGLDALTQLIEPYTCARTNPVVDVLCELGLRHSARALRLACTEGRDLGARTDLALAALCGGLALANAGLGVVHGLAAPLGGAYPAPHGAVCAALLPHALRTNLAALRSRSPDSDRIGRYDRIAVLLTGRPDATAEQGLGWIERLVGDLRIPRLRDFGVGRAAFPDLAARAAAASSMKANPIPLLPAEIVALLEAAW